VIIRRTSVAVAVSLALVVSSCGGDDDTAADTTEPSAPSTTESSSAAATTDGTATTEGTATTVDTAAEATTVPDDDGTTATTMTPSAGGEVVAGEPFPEERCAANRDAGTINYFSGFDYAAAASIVEVLVAQQAGYYDELCLDVEFTPSFSTANYALVADGQAQFSSSGSFSELATQAASNDADLVALSVDGYAPIDVLMVKPDRAASLDDLAGTTIGVKGALPPAVAVMLQQEAGLVEGDDYQTALLDGFDPVAQWAIPDISALPGWRSNEPGALERAGEAFDLYDPADYDVPGSFGLIYTSRDFLDAHPTAAVDFMRATIRGLADTIADPTAAAAAAFELVEANGNPNYLSAEGETFRATTDMATVVANLPEGAWPGEVVPDELAAQIEAYDTVGYYEAGAPPIDGRYDEALVASLYDADGNVIWPG
jgi:ABC-type nitrate/sulfonate/bicarbonate transport system substrate-binding protein